VGLLGARIAFLVSLVGASRRGDGRGRHGLIFASVEHVARFGGAVDSIRARIDSAGMGLLCGWAVVGVRP
jgi:hypothetical protein